LGRPVHGVVAGARGGGIAGEAAGRNRERGWVCCAREGTVKLKSYNNWTRLNREGRAGLTRAEEGRGGVGSIELGEGEREWSRLVWRKRELGRSFYRHPGRGRGREVASTGELATVVMVAHSGDDETARAGGDGMARAGARGQGRKAPTMLASELMARRRGGGDRRRSRR
jgi:hypothetical protein